MLISIPPFVAGTIALETGGAEMNHSPSLLRPEIGEPAQGHHRAAVRAGVQRLIDTEFEDGHRYYTKEAHVAELADDAIDALVGFWRDMPMEGEVEIIGLGGAIGDAAR